MHFTPGRPRSQQLRYALARDKTQIAYSIMGEGQPLLKAASWFTHLNSDASSPIWRHLMAELSLHHRFIRYDNRGCGMSDGGAGPATLDAWVDDISTVAMAAGAQRFTLFGASHGAPAAIAYAARHPDRVHQLILHGGFARGRLRRGSPPDDLDEARIMVRLAELGWDKENPATRHYFTAQLVPGASTEQARWLNGMGRLAMGGGLAARQLRMIDQVDLSEELAQIRCPVLILHSARDAWVPFSEARFMASRIPDARLLQLDSDNHFILEHEPAWHTWLDAFRAFLPVRGQRPRSIDCGLSRREAEVLELMARGCDNSQIAAHLELEVKTVRNYVTSVFSKLEVENRPQAIVLARNAGLGQV